MKPIIGITLGDVGGIGPEVILKSIKKGSILKKCRPLIIGCGDIVKKELSALGLPFLINRITDTTNLVSKKELIHVYDVESVKLPISFKKGLVSVSAAKAAMEYIKIAVQLALKNKLSAIVTAPINKEGIHKARFPFQGHTDYLAHLSKTKNYSMLFVYKELRVLLSTIHVDLKKVSSLITKALVYTKIKHAEKACQMFGIKKPTIAVAGLNPHAGEQGSFGKEELDEIIPAIKKAKKSNIKIEGPIPPDTLFYRGITKKEFDIMVCMYHDQGLIPFKMKAFDKGVNMTVGLPFIRTSPDHGTAYDIAQKRIASPDSMIEAILTAAQLAQENN